jgi:hypothetical protein
MNHGRHWTSRLIEKRIRIVNLVTPFSLYRDHSTSATSAWLLIQGDITTSSKLRGGSGFLLKKTQSPSPRVGHGNKPNFFIYVVKPEPELRLTKKIRPEPDPSPKKSGPTHLYVSKLSPTLLSSKNSLMRLPDYWHAQWRSPSFNPYPFH